MTTANAYKFYNDSTFTSGDNNTVYDIAGDLTTIINDGFNYTASSVTICNTGDNDMSIALSFDGTNYGDTIVILTRETKKLTNAGLKKIKLIYMTADTSYQLLAFSNKCGDVTFEGGTINSVLFGKNSATSSSEFIQTINNRLLTSNNPFTYEVARGSYSTMSRISRTGYNTDIDNAWEDIIPWGGTYTWPASQVTMHVVSSSANDSTSGTGIRTLRIEYLDNTFASHTVDVTMNGITPVVTSVSNIYRINDVYTLTVGTLGSAGGDISIQDTGNTITYSQIPSGRNASSQAVYTVPLGKTFYMAKWQIGSGYTSTGRFARFQILSKCDRDGNTLSYFYPLEDFSTTDGQIVIPFTIPFKIPAGTDMIIRAISLASSSNAQCLGGFAGWLE